MSGRTQFWVGSVMMALAVGLLVGGMVFPKAAYSQDAGEGRTSRFALVTGVPGTSPRSETLYIVDDMNEILYIFEYSSRAKEVQLRQATDIRRYSAKLLEARAKKERSRDRNR